MASVCVGVCGSVMVSDSEGQRGGWEGERREERERREGGEGGRREREGRKGGKQDGKREGGGRATSK